MDGNWHDVQSGRRPSLVMVAGGGVRLRSTPRCDYEETFRYIFLALYGSIVLALSRLKAWNMADRTGSLHNKGLESIAIWNRALVFPTVPIRQLVVSYIQYSQRLHRIARASTRAENTSGSTLPRTLSRIMETSLIRDAEPMTAIYLWRPRHICSGSLLLRAMPRPYFSYGSP